LAVNANKPQQHRVGRPSRLSKEEQRSRKQNLLTHGAPAAARSIADAIVIKDEDLFFLTEPDGSVPLGGHHGFGLYYHDCRFLNGYEIRLNGCPPDELVANAERGFMAILELTNPDFHGSDGEPIHKQELGIKCERVIEARDLVLHDRITVQNFALEPVEFPLSFTFQAGFEDVFTVRGFLGGKAGKSQRPRWQGDLLRFLYRGADGLARTLTVRFSEPVRRRGTTAEFPIRLGPKESRELVLSMEVNESKSVPRSASRRRQPDLKHVHAELRRSGEQWLGRHTEVRSDSVLLERVIERSLRDLRMLRSNLHRDEYFAAGIPWFATLFGRDSIITALQTLAFEPSIAEQTLRLLASYQGEAVDPWRDEEPGKILHELRVGELARLGEIPHTPYFGSVDATPLFLILLAEHANWTGDLQVFRDLRRNVERALGWIAHYGELDGDGYVKYRSQSAKGLVNQGWKDSGDAIVNADGSLATPPIALVEVQGYVYRAKVEIAALFRRLGEQDFARRLENEAAELRTRFNRDFWLSRHRIYALALEAGNRPAEVVSSNPGHALWAGIADKTKARSTVRRLMHDDMFTGWGIRTLASTERAYNPLGYHLGTVWPHDNAIIAAGFRRYGFDDEACRVFSAILDAATHFSGYRLPEVFGGFSRSDYGVPVRYPIACHPQAWAAGAVPYLIQTALGLAPEAFERRLRVVRPVLPPFVEWLELRRLRVGDARADLRFERVRGQVRVRVLRTDGRLDVVVESEGKFALPGTAVRRAA
jgi:glycogen debranching enzyme